MTHGRALPLLVAALATGASPARAALTPAELARVGLSPPATAPLPMDLAFTDARGRRETLAQAAAGRPLVLVFADYGCTSLCGPALSITAARLGETGLRPGADYRLAVAGLDPASTPAQAQAFGAGRLPPTLLRVSTLLTGAATAETARAAGYGYAFDAQARQYVHPVAAFVLTPEGRIAAQLSEIGLTAPALREAIATAGRGGVTGWTDRLALVCHAALVAVGRFDGGAIAGLRAGGVLTLLAMAAGGWLLVRRRGRSA